MTDGLKAHRTSGHVRPATIIDVAREAGVSFKTVSRVLNGETNVREETRLKVLEAVKTLNYRTNHNARNLRARHSHIICLFYANPSRNYIGEVQLGALQRCQAYGYSLITEDCSDNHTSLLALRAETKLAGAILTPPLSDDKNLISELENRGIPFVRIAPAEDVEHGQDVAIDDAAAAREMTEYLIGLGHRRIGFIKGADSHAQAVRRFAGYRQALEEEGISLDPDLIEDGDFAFDSGVSCSEKLLSLPDRPTAIFASNDDMAAGVLATAYRRQVNVPANLSVVGFDDTPLATTISPSLTTIYQPSRELAAEAVSMLLEEAAPTGDAPRHKLLEYKLMLRNPLPRHAHDAQIASFPVSRFRVSRAAMTKITPLPHIAQTKPYVPGGKLAGASGSVIMLASNENPFGPSPKAIEAMKAVAGDVHVYPDPEYRALRETIAEAVGIADSSRVMVSAGSDEIIHLLTQSYAGPGDEILFTEHAFSMYRVSALSHGATPVTVPETDLTAGVNAILGAVSERTKILFLANPNNPTGTMLPVEALEQLQDSLPPHVLFVVDGAYAEYVGSEYEAQIRDLVDRKANTVMMRTFSKIHGLAALRLGWGYMPAEIAETYQRIRGPFNVNGLAVAAGMASIQDTDFLTKSRDHNTDWRARMTAALNAMGLPTPHSDANFVLPEFGSSERAAAANDFLKARNILVRAVGGYGLPERLRITVGSTDDNQAVLDALKEFTASR